MIITYRGLRRQIRAARGRGSPSPPKNNTGRPNIVIHYRTSIELVLMGLYIVRSSQDDFNIFTLMIQCLFIMT